MELWVAARTDPEIREAMDEVARDVTRMIAAGASELFPELMARPRAGEVLDMGLAIMRGLAVLRFTSDEADVERRWRRARGHLLELYESALGFVRVISSLRPIVGTVTTKAVWS